MLRYLAVFVGGAAGALTRWSMGVTAFSPTGAFPWATFFVNVTGAFALGVLGVLLIERFPSGALLRPLLGIGFLGAYTTMSIMAIEGVRLIESGHAITALVYWASTLIVGLAAGFSGIQIARLRMG